MVALFVILSGTAVAAKSLITGAQIKDGSITGADVKNRSLTPRDFKGSVRGPRGLPGPAGPPGAPGAKGDKGDKGNPAATNVTIRYIDRAIPALGAVLGQVASCAAGEHVLSGGFQIFGIPITTVHVGASGPEPPAPQGVTPTGWHAHVFNPTMNSNGLLRIYVLCASP